MHKSLFRAARRGHLKLFQARSGQWYLKRKNSRGQWVMHIFLMGNFDLSKIS